jgi:hypothetical protein
MLNLNFSCGFSFFVLSLLLVVVDWLLIFGFKICFDKCHFHRMMMILAFEKVFCCCLCC